MSRVLKLRLLALGAALIVNCGFAQSTTPAPISINLAAPTPAASASSVPAPSATPATPSASPAAPASKPAAGPPSIPPPDPVPDAVNPFADEKNLPTPLDTINIATTPMNADSHRVDFDGELLLRLFITGPDFEWEFDPLDDWIIAPNNYGESLAFVYAKYPQVRLSFSLYGPKEFVPEVTPATIIQYLAAIREEDPKGFILTTPFPPGIPALPINHFANRGGQGVTYATTSPVLQLHHDWIADLNGEYVLVIKLVSPPALMSRAESQVRAVFDRGVARKGLGIVPPLPPGEAPSADTTKHSDG